MFKNLDELRAVHARTGGWDGTSPGHFFDASDIETDKSIELVRGRYVLVQKADREDTPDRRYSLYRATDKGQIRFVAWIADGRDVEAFIDECEAAES